MEPRKQFTFYRSFWEAIKGLPKKDRLPILEAIISYGLDGDIPQDLSQSQSAFFLLIKPVLDSGRKKASSGKQGGSKKKANVKQTETEKEKEEEKEKEVEIEIENECYICGEPGPVSPQPAKPVITLPLNDGSEFGVTEEMISEFSALYPAVDIMQELRNMRGWLLNNQKNRKTRSGIRRFINSWLSREQDKPKTRTMNTGQQQYTHGADRLAEMIRRGDFDD